MLPSIQPVVPPVAPPAPKLTDLEIKDAQLIFSSVWQDLEADFGRENLRFPKEIILLGGAPGAGKGTNTNFIARPAGSPARRLSSARCWIRPRPAPSRTPATWSETAKSSACCCANC